MKRALKHTAAKQAYRLPALQAALAVLGSIIMMIITNNQQLAGSILVAGVICVLPSLIFIWRYFSAAGASQAQKIVFNFLLGEVMKIVLTVALLIISFKYLNVSIATVAISFIILQQTMWLNPWLMRKPMQGGVA